VTVRVPTHKDGKSLYWEFATDGYDVGFGLFFEWVEAEDTQVYRYIKPGWTEDTQIYRYIKPGRTKDTQVYRYIKQGRTEDTQVYRYIKQGWTEDT